jgi:hypothetical protein
MLFKKLFRVLVVGGAVAGVHACATGSAAKSSDASTATREGSASDSADGGTAAEPPKAAPASAGGGVMGW